MKILKAFTLPVLAILFTSCGNIVGQDDEDFSLDDANSAQFSASQANDNWNGDSISPTLLQEFNCPTNPNIHPENDRTLDGRNRYRICASKRTNFSYLIEGEPSLSDTSICMIPATYLSGARAGFNVLADPEAKTTLLKACFRPTDEASQISFQNKLKLYRDPTDPTKPISIHGFFVVTETNFPKMQTCLKSGQPLACPDYSFGKL